MPSSREPRVKRKERTSTGSIWSCGARVSSRIALVVISGTDLARDFKVDDQ